MEAGQIHARIIFSDNYIIHAILAYRVPLRNHLCILYLSVAMVGFDPIIYPVNEGLSVTIFVRLMSTIAREVMVNFRTVDGTAVSTAGGDYTRLVQTITFEPGSSNIAFVSIQTAMDNLPELMESFTAVLSEAQPAGRVTITQDTATVEITDTSGILLFRFCEWNSIVCYVRLSLCTLYAT